MKTVTITVDLPQELLEALEVPLAEAGRKAKEGLAIAWFGEGKISSGKAAQMLELSKHEFIDLLDHYGVAYLDAGPEEVVSDIENINKFLQHDNDK